jgi:glycosyltransferase involved in cell wall biosynthesis
MVPKDADIIHFHQAPPDKQLPDIPYLITEHGNRERQHTPFLPNTVFLSKNHAHNHGCEYYVYNGIPIEEYPLCEEKDDYMLFLARTSRRKKNILTAVNLAIDERIPLYVGGGSIWSTHKAWGAWILRGLNRLSLIRNLGDVDGEEKLTLLQKSRLFFHLVNWHEPFGLAPHEAMATGTPVLSTPNGAMPEYITSGENGFIVGDYKEARNTVRAIYSMSESETNEMARRCRDSAFTIEKCVEGYLEMYHEVMKRGYLYPPEQASRLIYAPTTLVNVLR